MECEEVTTQCRRQSVVPEIDDSRVEIDAKLSSRDKLLRLLDDIEDRVEKFRKGALCMEEEKDFLITSIDGIKSSDLINELVDSEKDAIFNYVERVSSKCGTVEVSVRTERNGLQEESLYQVNVFINNLVSDLKCDPFVVKDRCISYMAACSSKDEIYDKNFETALLGCTLDDQNRIKRRLQGLLSYIDSTYEVTVENDD